VVKLIIFNQNFLFLEVNSHTSIIFLFPFIIMKANNQKLKMMFFYDGSIILDFINPVSFQLIIHLSYFYSSLLLYFSFLL